MSATYSLNLRRDCPGIKAAFHFRWSVSLKLVWCGQMAEADLSALALQQYHLNGTAFHQRSRNLV